MHDPCRSRSSATRKVGDTSLRAHPPELTRDSRAERIKPGPQAPERCEALGARVRNSPARIATAAITPALSRQRPERRGGDVPARSAHVRERQRRPRACGSLRLRANRQCLRSLVDPRASTCTGSRERLDVARGGSPFGSSVQTSGRYRGVRATRPGSRQLADARRTLARYATLRHPDVRDEPEGRRAG